MEKVPPVFSSPGPGLLVGNWGFRPGVTRAEEGVRAGGGIFLSFRHNLLVLRVVLIKRKKIAYPRPEAPCSPGYPRSKPQVSD